MSIGVVGYFIFCWCCQIALGTPALIVQGRPLELRRGDTAREPRRSLNGRHLPFHVGEMLEPRWQTTPCPARINDV